MNSQNTLSVAGVKPGGGFCRPPSTTDTNLVAKGAATINAPIQNQQEQEQAKEKNHEV